MISLMCNLKTIQKNTRAKQKQTSKKKKEKRFRGFTGSSLIKSLPASAGGVGSILGQDDPLQEEMQPTPVFSPGESMDRGAWQAIVHGVAKSWA